MNWKQSLISGATVLTLGSLSLLSGDNDVHASEVEIVPITSEVEVAPDTSVVQISDGSDISYEPESEVWADGEYLGKIVVEEEENLPISTRSFYSHSETVKNKSYNIHFIGGSANIGFGINVKNKIITKAYDAWSNGILYVVSKDSLKFTAKQATLPGNVSVFFKGFPVGTSFRLKATIKGDKLVTTLDIP